MLTLHRRDANTGKKRGKEWIRLCLLTRPQTIHVPVKKFEKQCSRFRKVILKQKHTSELPGGLARPHPSEFDSVGLDWNLIICIFNKFPGDAVSDTTY